MTTPEDVVAFWQDAGRDRWFRRDDAFDQRFRERFLAAHFAASRRALESWMASAEGALALMILLDQFPRNCFRGSAHAYATDPLARHYADRALARGFDAQVEPALCIFFILPFQHSEDLRDQERALTLARACDDAFIIDACERHLEVIVRYGRFPHRNAELGRIHTPDEQAYLDAGGGFIPKPY